MPARTRLEREYILTGIVVDRITQRGVAGVVIEAWDHDTKFHDMLGQATADADGQFVMAFDREYFGNAAPDRGADLFFRVYLDDREVLTTFDKPLRNLQPGRRDVRLEIDLPQVQTGRDRVTTEQAIKAVDWWRASDFRGVFTQGLDKTRTVGSMVGALLGDAFRNFDFEPVRPRSTREREIVNQPAHTARVALIQQQVEVTAVRPASTLRGARRSIADYPVTLRAGDRVTLYEENGLVTYYTRDTPPASAADGATVARIDEDVQAVKAQVAAIGELRTELENTQTLATEVSARAAEEAERANAHADALARLQAQLDEVQRISASKDAQIAKLQNDISLVTKAQDALAATLERRISGIAAPGGTPADVTAPHTRPTDATDTRPTDSPPADTRPTEPAPRPRRPRRPNR
jgi:hypothetical protein